MLSLVCCGKIKMRKGGDPMNKEQMAHNIAMVYAKSELDKECPETAQSKIMRIMEDYCAAYGFVMSQDDQYVQALTRRGE